MTQIASIGLSGSVGGFALEQLTPVTYIIIPFNVRLHHHLSSFDFLTPFPKPKK